MPVARRGARSLFGIAPGGACHAGDVTTPAVRSYRTVSPLPPRWYRLPDPLGWRYIFCGAVRRVAPPGRYPAPFLLGVRTFLEPVAKPAAIQPSARCTPSALGRAGSICFEPRMPPAGIYFHLEGGTWQRSKSAVHSGPLRHGAKRRRVVCSNVSNSASAVKPAWLAVAMKLSGRGTAVSGAT